MVTFARRKRVKVIQQLFPLISCLLLNFLQEVYGYFELCKDGSILTIRQADCPGGVLFPTPISPKCIYPNLDSSSRDHLSDMCDNNAELQPGDKALQYIDVGGDDHDYEDKDSYNVGTCKVVDPSCSEGYVSVNQLNTNRGDDVVGGEEVDYGEEPASADNSPDDHGASQNQTLRLFMYMTGGLIDEGEGGPNFRLTELLQKSFKILQKHCPTSYVPSNFTEDLLKGFLFLLRESDTGGIRDITAKQFRDVKKILENCLAGGASAGKPTFALEGSVCKTTAKVKHVVKMIKKGSKSSNHSEPYELSDDSFRWGKYDQVIDGTWGAVDFVHGLCYGSFSADANAHHLYERAMERMFSTKSILHRWSRPVRLFQDFYWDHIFRANVKASMRNMDACIQGAYMGQPFVRRLKRPWMKQTEMIGGGVTTTTTTPDPNDTRRRRRRKRSPTAILKQAYCFQSQQEKEEKIRELCGS